MENTNPWLEITKQKEDFYDPRINALKQLSREPLFSTRVGQVNTFNRIRLEQQLDMLQQAKEFQNPTVESEYDQEDIDAAICIIDAYYDDDKEEFIEYCWLEHGIPDPESSDIWMFLYRANSNNEISPVSLTRFLYEEHIWD